MRGLNVKVELAGLTAAALNAAWLSGAQAGVAVGVFVGLVAGYLMWGERKA